MSQLIYMDYNATAPLRPEAKEAMLRIIESPHNASSVHNYGRNARQIVEEARVKVAALVGAKQDQVIFNSGATEGNNTVLHHFAGQRILVSAIEHPSVLEATPEAQRIPVTPDGIVDLAALEGMLGKEKTALVSVMLVNNETGIIQPIKEISALAKKHGALTHCDAVQAIGRIPVNLNTLCIDFLTISAHKIGGPQGVGALILGLCGETPTLLYGGGQEKKARAGTENVAGIAGFGEAAKQAFEELDTMSKTLENYRNKFEEKLTEIQKGINAPSLIFHGQNVGRAGNTSMFSVPGLRSESLLMALDLEGIAISNGSACTSGSVQPSHVLKAMGASEEDANSALRISLGWDTKDSDIDRFCEAWSKIYERINKNKEEAPRKNHA